MTDTNIGQLMEADLEVGETVMWSRLPDAPKAINPVWGRMIQVLSLIIIAFVLYRSYPAWSDGRPDGATILKIAGGAIFISLALWMVWTVFKKAYFNPVFQHAMITDRYIRLHHMPEAISKWCALKISRSDFISARDDYCAGDATISITAKNVSKPLFIYGVTKEELRSVLTRFTAKGAHP